MKQLFLALSMIVFAACAMARDTIITSDGDYVPAPAGYKAVFVPNNTGDTLVSVKAVKLVTPVPVEPVDPEKLCTARDQLTLGGAPCPE